MILFCKDCGKVMNKVLHYEPDKSNTYWLCKNCYYSTRPKKIIYEADQSSKAANKTVDKITDKKINKKVSKKTSKKTSKKQQKIYKGDKRSGK